MGTTGQSITLANSIIGVGILAMPFCFQQCGVLLATLILLFMGLISRLCCYFLLKSALITRRRNFEFLAFHVFGPVGKLAVELGIIGFLMGTCIAYFVVVGDLGPQIISKMFNINQSDILRTSIMVIVSLVCVLPLGLLRNVDSLSNVSAATIGFYFCLVLKVIAEAASQLIAGDWQSRLELWKPSGLLQCVPIFCMALFCQTQLFEIFESLPYLSLEKMNVVTKNAINICTGVYFTLGLFGYIAFCAQDISGNILMSLSPTMGSDVIKLGFVMSLAFSFPLIIFPCRASLYSFLFKKVHHHQEHVVKQVMPTLAFRCITISIVGTALFVSLLIPNIELVLGLLGSTIGVMICVVFPAACFVNVTFKDTNERLLAKMIVVLGLIIMVLGTYANLQAAENSHERRDEKLITQERIDKMVEDFFEKYEKPDLVDPKAVEKVEDQPELSIVNKAINGESDSVFQPPNPVPPETQVKEKNLIIEEQKVPKEEPAIEIKQENPVIMEPLDKVSESHPKNIKVKMDEKEMQRKENIDEKPKEEKVISPSQEKIDMIKQQQLIETIKQHGEEQKELIAEQKEILHEIRKTKEELEKKNEIDSNDAKKIAVESIQKIANMAIQSLGGVTDQPQAEKLEKKAENIEQVANEAVQEIAKKAVETIEALKENAIKLENPLKPTNLDDVKPVVNNPQINQSIQPNVANPVEVQPPVVPVAANIPEINNIVEPEKVALPSKSSDNIPQKPIESQADNIVKPVQDPSNVVKPLKNLAINNQQPQQNFEAVAEKLPDKPLSYKQGEDLQNKIIAAKGLSNEVLQALPIAMAMSGNTKTNNNPQNIVKPNDIKITNNGININNANVPIAVNNDKNDALTNIVGDKTQVRNKREVVDCTEKSRLKPEDKQICDTLIDNQLPQDILSNKVDLGEVGLRKPLPVDDLYHIRSLKSVTDNKRKR